MCILKNCACCAGCFVSVEKLIEPKGTPGAECLVMHMAQALGWKGWPATSAPTGQGCGDGLSGISSPVFTDGKILTGGLKCQWKLGKIIEIHIN